MIQIVGIVLFFSLICPASAQTLVRPGGDKPIWTPLVLRKFDDGTPWKATVPKEMIASLRVSDVTVPLEEDTKLEDMQTRFGGKIGTQGDAADSLSWLCIYGSDSAGPWVLWLESGEVDGPYVGAFQWRRVSHSAQFDRRCSALPDTSEVELPIDLRLGAAEASVIRTLGRLSSRRANTLLYEHEHNELIRGEEFSSSNTVIVDVRRGVIWAIQVGKTTTN